MSIIEDALKGAAAEEVKVEDLRPGDTIILWEPYECGIYGGTFVNSGPTGDVTVKDDSGYEQYLYLGEEQRWYLVERAPVEEPTGWGAIVEVGGVKYSRVPYESGGDDEPWVREAGSWHTWAELIEEGAPKILFEGISE